MSKLYETVQTVLARGPRSMEEIITECRRVGLTCRPETIALFLALAHEVFERDGAWCRKGGAKHERIRVALRRAFSAGQTYLPIERLAQFLDEGEGVTGDDVAAACEESGEFRVQGKLILRVQ